MEYEKIESRASLTNKLFAANVALLVGLSLISVELNIHFLIPYYYGTYYERLTYLLLTFLIPAFVMYALSYVLVFNRIRDQEMPRGSRAATVLGILCILTLFMSLFGIGLLFLSKEIPWYRFKDKREVEKRIEYTRRAQPANGSDLEKMKRLGRVQRIYKFPGVAISVLWIILLVYAGSTGYYPFHIPPAKFLELTMFVFLLGFMPLLIIEMFFGYYLKRSYPYLVGMAGTVITKPSTVVMKGRGYVRINEHNFFAFVPTSVEKGDRVEVSKVVYDRWYMDWYVYCKGMENRSVIE